MVLLTITPATCHALGFRARLQGDTTSAVVGEPDLSHPVEGDPISHSQLVDLSSYLKSHESELKNEQDVSADLETLLKGARIYAPPPAPKPAKSPEYIQLMARLREEEERRAYDRMINPQLPGLGFAQHASLVQGFGSSMGPAYDEADDATFSDINRQMTLIINVLVTIIACSVGIWVTAWHWPTPARLALSLLGSGAVAVAEVVIYLGYIKRISDAKTKESRTKESKEVIDTWVLDGKGRKVAAGGRDESLRQRKGKHR